MQITARDTDIMQHLIVPLTEAQNRFAIAAGDDHSGDKAKGLSQRESDRES